MIQNGNYNYYWYLVIWYLWLYYEYYLWIRYYNWWYFDDLIKLCYLLFNNFYGNYDLYLILSGNYSL